MKNTPYVTKNTPSLYRPQKVRLFGIFSFRSAFSVVFFINYGIFCCILF